MTHGNTLWTSLLVSLSLMLVKGVSPGFVGRIRGKGLDLARREGVAALQRELPKISLPDVSGSTRFFGGNLYYRFWSLNMHSFWLPSSTITPIPHMGLRVSINDAYTEVSGQWRWRYWLAQDEGLFDMMIERLSIPVSLELGSDSRGKLTATISACSTRISNVRVHLFGTWRSWFYNLFDDQIGSFIRRLLVDQVCKIISQIVHSRVQPFLQSLPVTANIDKMSGINYSLVGPPVTRWNSLNLKGEFFSLAHRSAAPFPPPAVPFPVDHDCMLYFGVSGYLFSTAGHVYYQAGALTYDITDDMIPKDSELRLNTSSFGALVPQIEESYPGMLMKLVVSPSSPPSLAIAPEGLSLAPTVDIQAFAILPNSSLAPLFVLNVSTTILVNAAVESNKIVGSLKLGRLEVSLKHSDVGPFSEEWVEEMEEKMNLAANILVPQMNERLAQGFPLPLPDDLQLANLVFRLQENFCSLESILTTFDEDAKESKRNYEDQRKRSRTQAWTPSPPKHHPLSKPICIR